MISHHTTRQFFIHFSQNVFLMDQSSSYQSQYPLSPLEYWGLTQLCGWGGLTRAVAGPPGI